MVSRRDFLKRAGALLASMPAVIEGLKGCGAEQVQPDDDYHFGSDLAKDVNGYAGFLVFGQGGKHFKYYIPYSDQHNNVWWEMRANGYTLEHEWCESTAGRRFDG